MIRILIDPVAPDREALARAADVLARGGVVAYPTDTLYGLAVDPRRAAAVEALYRIKARGPGEPFPLIAASQAQVEARVGRLSDLERRLARQFWPGPLTLVIAAAPPLAEALHSTSGRVAVRVPAHAVAVGLAALADHPVTSTSANRSGQPASAAPDDVARGLADSIDLLLDGGAAPGGPPSTVVDTAGPVPVLLRAGAVPWERVLESLHTA